jgi:hypothetical protein
MSVIVLGLRETIVPYHRKDFSPLQKKKVTGCFVVEKNKGNKKKKLIFGTFILGWRQSKILFDGDKATKKMETIEQKVRDFIAAKQVWRDHATMPNRISYKKKYQAIERELLIEMPDEFEVDGFVLKKGFVRSPEKNYPYVAIYTKASYENRKSYLHIKNIKI